MNKRISTLKRVFPLTIPVMTGYLALGIALGILMHSKGYSMFWVIFSSTFIYAGTMQFMAIPLLASGFNPVNAFILTIMINARFMFYGISMLRKFSNTGKYKPYLIFGLTDETFSLLNATEINENEDKGELMCYITLLNHLYWIIGSILGYLINSLFSFNTMGIDFVLTALFVVIFIDKWKQAKSKSPLILGLVAAILARFIFGPVNLIIPTMIIILVVVTLLKDKKEWRDL